MELSIRHIIHPNDLGQVAYRVDQKGWPIQGQTAKQIAANWTGLFIFRSHQ